MENKYRLLEEINKVLDNKLDIWESIMISPNTPIILQEIGLKDYPILMSQRHVRNCLHEKGKSARWHGLTKEYLSNVEEYLKAPAIIYDSLTGDDSIVVVTDQVDGDRLPIVVSIKTNGEGQYEFNVISSNYLTSTYGHEHLENILDRAIMGDDVLYVNKEKTQNLEAFSKLQLLGRFSEDFEFDTIVHKSNNIVNNSEEIISDFREKTDKYFDKNAFDGLTPEEIEDDVRAYISSTLYMHGLNHNIEIEDVIITGSRSRGLENETSDLDIAFSYKSPVVEGTRGYKEDELFNLLNEYDENDEEDRDLHELHGIKIDINPIRPEETGFLADYLITAEEYLESKRKELEMPDNISHSFINDKEKMNDFLLNSQ